MTYKLSIKQEAEKAKNLGLFCGKSQAIDSGDAPYCDNQWRPMEKDRKGWIAVARKEAQKRSKRDGFLYLGCVFYVESKGAYRIRYCADYTVVNK